MCQTDPYKYLEYCIGNDDYFFCFDYCVNEDDKIVLHCVINSESGGFIDTVSKKIVNKNDAPKEALLMTDQAIQALVENGVTHDKKGWNQDEYKFYRAICEEVGIKSEI